MSAIIVSEDNITEKRIRNWTVDSDVAYFQWAREMQGNGSNLYLIDNGIYEVVKK